MSTFFKTMTYILLAILVACMISFFITGTFYPISGIVLILFLVVVVAAKKGKDKK